MRWITDAGHGWLAVSFADLADVGAAIGDFSGYSYINRKLGILYLEEDSDAPRFIARHPARNTDFFRILQADHLTDSSDRNLVRRCPRLSQVRQ
jgi:hypothetical protein